MNTVDVMILIVLLVTMAYGFIRGFVRSALSLVGWVAVLYIAVTFMSGFAELFAKSIDDQTLRLIVSFILLVVFGLIAMYLANFFVGRVVEVVGLSGIDRTIGIFFGFLLGVSIVTAVVMLLLHTTLPKEPWWKESFFMFRFEVIAAWLKDLLL